MQATDVPPDGLAPFISHPQVVTYLNLPPEQTFELPTVPDDMQEGGATSNLVPPAKQVGVLQNSVLHCRPLLQSGCTVQLGKQTPRPHCSFTHPCLLLPLLTIPRPGP
jgi:hypothetical protein